MNELSSTAAMDAPSSRPPVVVSVLAFEVNKKLQKEWRTQRRGESVLAALA